MTEKHVVTVEYIDNPGLKYDFFNRIAGIKKGDTVVARSRHGLGICRVTNVKQHSNKANAWIVSKVVEDELRELLLMEDQQEVLIDRMRDRVKQYAEAELFSVIAQGDPNMFGLLNQWRELENKKQGRG
jgi:hypothetical protein